jgi:hypothetical protein
MSKLDLAFVVASVVAALWFAADSIWPQPTDVKPGTSASARRAAPPASAVKSSERPSKASSEVAMPRASALTARSPIPMQEGSIAIDPFADGGPAEVVVRPEPPAFLAPTEARDEAAQEDMAQ